MAASQPTFQQQGATPASRMEEKHEKHEKGEKGEKNEKGEKGEGGGFLGALVGGSILIWLGVTFYLEQNGYLRSDIWWAYFLTGIGAILILQGVVFYTRGHRGFGSVIGGAVLVFIGLSAIATSTVNLATEFWPLLIVAMGVFVLAGGITSRRRAPRP